MARDNIELLANPANQAPLNRNVSDAEVARLHAEYKNAEAALDALINAAANADALRAMLVKESQLHEINGSNIIKGLTALQDEAKAKLNAANANATQAIKDAHEALNTSRLNFAKKKNDLENLKKSKFAITKINLNFDLPSMDAGQQQALMDFRQQHDPANQLIVGSGGGPDSDSPISINLADSLTNESNTLIHKSDENANVTIVDNKVTYSNPQSGAYTIRAKGWHTYKFEKVSMLDKGDLLIEATKQMLIVGMEDITFSDQLLIQAQSNMSSSNYKDFEQLKRICDASRSVYQDEPGNRIFDDKGLKHAVATFKRLATDDDRRAYLELLNPNHNMEFYAGFIKQLNGKNIMFNQQTPEEYFQTKMVRLPHRKHALKKSIEKLHDSEFVQLADPKVAELRTKATAAERAACFNAIEPKLQRAAWNKLSTNPVFRTEILQHYLAELASAIEQGNESRKAEIKQNLRELLHDTKAEELQEISQQLKNAHAYAGTNLSQNLSLVDFMEIVKDLPGKGCADAAKQFAPKNFFLAKLDQEMPKQFLVPQQANTTVNDLQARIECYKNMMAMYPDKSFDSRLKVEIQDIVNHFEKSHPGQGWVKQSICNALRAVFNDNANAELREHMVNFTEDVNTHDARDPWSSLERMERSHLVR